MSKEAAARALVAYKFMKFRIRTNIPGGSHPLGPVSAMHLISAINPQPGDIIWEIGCGEPLLASAMSACMNGGRVICTDIDHVFNALRSAVTGFMHTRRADAGKQLLIKMRDLKIAASTCVEYCSQFPVDYKELKTKQLRERIIGLKFEFLKICGLENPREKPKEYELRFAVGLTEIAYPAHCQRSGVEEEEEEDDLNQLKRKSKRKHKTLNQLNHRSNKKSDSDSESFHSNQESYVNSRKIIRSNLVNIGLSPEVN